MCGGVDREVTARWMRFEEVSGGDKAVVVAGGLCGRVYARVRNIAGIVFCPLMQNF